MSAVDAVSRQAKQLEREAEAMRAAVRANQQDRQRTERAMEAARQHFEQRDREVRRELAELEQRNEQLAGSLEAANQEAAEQRRALERQRAEARQRLVELEQRSREDQERLRTELREIDERHQRAIAALGRQLELEAERQLRLAANRAERAGALCLLAEQFLSPWLEVLEPLDLTTVRNRLRRQIAAARGLVESGDAEAALGVAVLAADAARALGDESLARQAQLATWRDQLCARTERARQGLRTEPVERFYRAEAEGISRELSQLAAEAGGAFREYLWAAPAFYNLSRRVETVEQRAAVLAVLAAEAAEQYESRRVRMRQAYQALLSTLAGEAVKPSRRLIDHTNPRSDVLVTLRTSVQTLRLRFPLREGIVLEESSAPAILRVAQERLAKEFGAAAVQIVATSRS
jgi:hypothetical protein